MGTAVATAPSVRVQGREQQQRAPASVVTFAVTAGGGTITTASATTNATGIATVRQLDAGDDGRREHG